MVEETSGTRNKGKPPRPLVTWIAISDSLVGVNALSQW
ncbi:unnamed protein product [Linum tenue]|uniref:Uncharacterized protein n=1 Tax=Linum tenue TaxID=586396 RepID=A0AAV0QTD3_9ROSI|nr:unnamed protein product [Linum tenue]